MANKPLQFIITQQKVTIGPNKGKMVQIARPTGRHRIDFRGFCDRVSKSTTFNRQEVEAVLNYATEIARDIVAGGDIVDFGDLGSLKPSFKSKAIPVGTEFRALEHISKPVVRLCPSKKYFTLTGVSYEQTIAKPKKETGKPKPDSGGSSSKPKPDSGGSSSETGA